jgi:hypothetical protein
MEMVNSVNALLFAGGSLFSFGSGSTGTSSSFGFKPKESSNEGTKGMLDSLQIGSRVQAALPIVKI